jgi:hypothetical protein
MIITDTLTEGFFGQILIWILECLPFVDRINTGLTCRIKCRNYGVAPDFDCIAPYLDHVFPHRGETNEVYNLKEIKLRHGARFIDFTTPNRLWNKHFTFKSHILDEVDAFVASHFNGRTLGIHYRGCDKMKGHSRQGGLISYDEMDTFIEDYCNASSKCPDTLFVASDEADYIHHVREKYGNQFNVVYRNDSVRNERDTSSPLFYWTARCTADHAQKSDFGTTAIGVDAICNSLLLSKCDAVLKTSSALSAWAKIFNPNIEIYRVNAFLFTWFPEAHIPIYPTRTTAVQKLLGVTMIGDGSIRNC